MGRLQKREEKKSSGLACFRCISFFDYQCSFSFYMKELPEFLISPVQIYSKNIFACPILNSMFCVNLFYIEVAFIYQLELCYRMNRLQILDTHFRASNWNEQIVATFKGILVFFGVRIRDGQVIKYERKIFFVEIYL